VSDEPLAYSNGEFVPRSRLVLDVADVGFVAGATVTDYMRTYGHRLFHQSEHRERFRADCKSCDIRLSPSDAELADAAERLIEHNAKLISADEELSLITFATPGPLGYMAGREGHGPATMAMHTFPMPWERYRRFFSEGISLVVVGDLPRYGECFAHLNTAKHRSRIHWHLARQHPLAKQHRDAIPAYRTADGGLDTAIGAAMWLGRDRQFFAARHCLYSLSLRRIAGWLEADGWQRAERYAGGTEAILAGSAFGVAGIRRVIAAEGEAEFAWPGPGLQSLARQWNDDVGLDIVAQFLHHSA